MEKCFAKCGRLCPQIDLMKIILSYIFSRNICPVCVFNYIYIGEVCYDVVDIVLSK